MRKNLIRSETYRTDFIRHNPPKHGLYFCVYCGRPIKKEKMQVDHIIAIHLARKNRLYRSLIHEDINELSNLAPACRKCNRRKSDKGGLWVLRGKFWKICLPIHIGLQLGVAALFVFGILVTLEYEPAINIAADIITWII